jgi:hypothetical protein
MGLTKEEIENIQIDYGVVFINHGEIDAFKFGPSRGGGEFKADHTIRDIEIDGQKGKTKGLQVIEEINAMLAVVVLNTSIKTLALSMPYATLEGDGDTIPYAITCKSSNVGILPDTAYLKNVTMFCRTVKGEYRKITLYNAMSENSFELKAKPKGEGEVALEFNAHWDPEDDAADLFKIETVESILVA